MVKNKIQLAQINNEKYSEYEKVRDKLLKEIGYSIEAKRRKRLTVTIEKCQTKVI